MIGQEWPAMPWGVRASGGADVRGGGRARQWGDVGWDGAALVRGGELAAPGLDRAGRQVVGVDREAPRWAGLGHGWGGLVR